MTDLTSAADDDSSAAGQYAEAAATTRPRLPRRLMFAGAVCFGVLALGLVWVIVTGLIARADLQHAQAELPQLRSALLAGDVGKANALSTDIATRADRAHSLVSGPAWWVAANLPVAGTPLQTSRTIASTADTLGTQVLPGIVRLGDTIHSSSLRAGSSINLAVLSRASTVVDSARTASARALASLTASTSSSWLSPVDRSRASLVHQLVELNGDLSGASRTLRTVVPMLGQEGTRRYFVGFENEAESRGLGGLPGAFAILTVDHGAFRFTHFGNDDTLHGVRADVDLGADYNAQYGSADPTGVFQNSDIGPDFRDAAQIWAGMWEKKSGEHVDGAVAVDPTALSYLLRVTGPATLKSGGQVTADNVVALTQQTQYSKFSNLALRKKYVVDVSDAISKRITAAGGSTTALLKTVARAAHERRLVLWSSHKPEQANIQIAGFGGILDSHGAPFTGFVTVNAAGSKLDYYLGRKQTYTRLGCGTGSTSVATFKLSNDAPRSGLPPYVTIRADKPKYRTVPGDNRVNVTYYGTPGAVISSATIDGKPAPVSVGREHGLLTVSVGLELPVQAARTFAVTLKEPAANKPLQLLQQPAVRPVKTLIAGPACHS